MNKKILGQIELYLGSLLSRLEENSDAFRSIEIQFKSGTKMYPANIVPGDEDNTYIWSHSGRKDSVQMGQIVNYLIPAAEKYDSMDLKYIEDIKTVCIVADEKKVKLFTENTKEQIDTIKKSVENSHIGNREYIIKAGEADELLKAIGIMAPNGKIKNDMIRKYNQIDHFVELVSGNIKELCKNKKEITVLDCACGKSYLSFVLNYYIKHILRMKCSFIGVDYSDTVINASEKMASELRYTNMKFIKTNLKEFSPQKNIDLCISLHACDTATDMALACAVQNNAGMIIAVPCCHKELLNQYRIDGMESLLKYGILKARISDALTDSLRANFLEAMGYEVSVVEYISPLETPKNLMIRAYKKDEKDLDKIAGYWDLCRKLNVSPSLPEFVL